MRRYVHMDEQHAADAFAAAEALIEEAEVRDIDEAREERRKQ